MLLGYAALWILVYAASHLAMVRGAVAADAELPLFISLRLHRSNAASIHSRRGLIDGHQDAE